MATTSQRLAWILSLDSDSAIKGFEQVGSKAEKELGRVESGLDRTAGQMMKLGAGATAAAGIAGAALWKLGDAASDLAETQSKTNQVFGEAASKVEAWASTADRAAGLSKRSAMDAASTFGALFTNIGKSADEAADMSLKMTKLAADMASFGNTSPEEAIQALGAALRGESEPIRKYNVLLDDATLKQRAMALGIYEGTGSLSTQQRAQAAYAEILAQTTKIQGDFARTADGAANQGRVLAAQMDNLKTSIGAGVTPAMTTMLGTANSALGAINSLGDGALSTAGTFATFGTAAVGAVGALSTVSGMAIKARENLKNADGGLNLMGKSAVGLTTVLGAGALATAIVQVSDGMRGMDAFAKKAASSMADFGDSVDRVAEINERVTRSMDLARYATIRSERGTIDKAEATKQLRNNLEQLAAILQTGNIVAAQRYRDAMVQAGLSVDEANRMIDEQTGALRQNKADMEESRKIIDGTTSAQATFSESVELTDKELKELQKELDDYDGRLRALTNATFGAAEADAAWNKALTDWQATIKENGPVLDTWTKKGQENYEATKNVAEALGTVISKAAQEYPNSVDGFRNATDQYVNEWKKQLAASGLSNAEVEKFLGYIDKLRTQEEINIRARIRFAVDDNEGKRGFERLGNADPEAAARVLDSVGYFGVSSHAAGGTVPGPYGKPRLVVAHGGERWPGLDGGAGSSNPMASGGGGPLIGTLNVSVWDESQKESVARAVADAIRRQIAAVS